MGILVSLCLANTSYCSFNTLLRECGPGGTHTLSRSALAYLRDSQHQCWTLMALVTFLSRTLAVVTMDVLTG